MDKNKKPKKLRPDRETVFGQTQNRRRLGVISFILSLGFPWQGMAKTDFFQNCHTKDYILARAIDVGSTPKGLAISKDGQTAYVANMYSRTQNPTVTLLNLNDFTTSTIITPRGIPGFDYGEILGNIEVIMGPLGEYAYVTRASGDQTSEVAASGLVTAIDLSSQEIHGYFPLYSENENGGPSGSKILKLRPESNSSQKQIAYVANWFTNEQHISVIDLVHLSPPAEGESPKAHFDGFIKHIPLETRFPSSRTYQIAPRDIQFTSDGRYAIVAGYNSRTLFIIDGIHHMQIGELPRIPFPSSLNFRHFSYDKDQDYLYISHMVGDRISRLDLSKLIDQTVKQWEANGHNIVFHEPDIWKQIQVPFANGQTYLRTDLHYPNGHPYNTGDNPVSGPANPNTIVLHPNNKFLFVSNRMTFSKNYNDTPKKHWGKIDIIDTTTGEFICSLNGGRQTTALDISADGSLLVSSSFQQGTVDVFDTQKLIDDYTNANLGGE